MSDAQAYATRIDHNLTAPLVFRYDRITKAGGAYLGVFPRRSHRARIMSRRATTRGRTRGNGEHVRSLTPARPPCQRERAGVWLCTWSAGEGALLSTRPLHCRRVDTAIGEGHQRTYPDSTTRTSPAHLVTTDQSGAQASERAEPCTPVKGREVGTYPTATRAVGPLPTSLPPLTGNPLGLRPYHRGVVTNPPLL